MTQTPFKAGPPITEIPKAEQEEAPKRRRGRPPGSKNKPRANLKVGIGGTLEMFNMAIGLTPLASDALDRVEIEALTEAINEECNRSPAFRKYVEYAVNTVSGGGSLIAVVAIIGARRVSRHGLLPKEIDPQLGGLLALSMGKLPPSQPEPKPDAIPLTPPTQPQSE